MVAADSYLAARGSGRTVLAGFPWFTDWGRDTFISLRGLLIARGRLTEAAEILLAWAGLVSEGMLPNRFPDGDGPPEYNAADASLWFIVAVHELIEAGGASRAVAARLREACTAIVEGYTNGTRYGIGADRRDGLLRAGVPGVQLTWMDAKTGDHVVTPAHRQAGGAAGALGQRPGHRRALARRRPRLDQPGFARAPQPDGAVPGPGDGRPDRRSGRGRGGWRAGPPGAAEPGAGGGRAADPRAQPAPDCRRGRGGGALLANRRSDCARWRRMTRTTSRSTAAAPLSGTAPTTRAPSGLGCSARSSTPGWPAATTRKRRGRKAGPAFSRRFNEHLHTAGLGHVSEVADGDAPHSARWLSVSGLVAGRINTHRDEAGGA